VDSIDHLDFGYYYAVKVGLFAAADVVTVGLFAAAIENSWSFCSCCRVTVEIFVAAVE